LVIYPARKYIEYLLFSRHRKGYGIHSPFVFDLVSRIFRNKIEPDIVCTIEALRRKLKADPRSISTNDLGSGSGKMKSNVRKVSDIASYSAVTRKYGIFLSRMAEAFAGSMVVEFGTSLGISTMYMASICPDTQVYTMEGCPATAEIASDNFREAGLSNITQLTGPFEDLLPEIINKKITPGLVFIDGNHRKEPVIGYFNRIAAISDGSTVILIDDIYSTPEMTGAWSEIKEHSDVTLTVDIYRMGLVFFREGLPGLHYVIRY